MRASPVFSRAYSIEQSIFRFVTARTVGDSLPQSLNREKDVGPKTIMRDYIGGRRDFRCPRQIHIVGLWTSLKQHYGAGGPTDIAELAGHARHYLFGRSLTGRWFAWPPHHEFADVRPLSWPSSDCRRNYEPDPQEHHLCDRAGHHRRLGNHILLARNGRQFWSGTSFCCGLDLIWPDFPGTDSIAMKPKTLARNR
jgi:hypothetical protein